MVRERLKKSGNFILSQHIEEKSGKIELYITANLILLMARRNISGQCDLSDVCSFGSGGWRLLLFGQGNIIFIREK